MAEARPLCRNAILIFRREIGRLHGIVKARCVTSLYMVGVAFLQPLHRAITIYFIMTSKSKTTTAKKKKSIVELLTLHLKVLVLVDFRTPGVNHICCTILITQVPDFSLEWPSKPTWASFVRNTTTKMQTAVCCYSPARQRLNWKDSCVAVLYWRKPLPNTVKLNIILVMVLTVLQTFCDLAHWDRLIGLSHPPHILFRNTYLQPNVFLNSSKVLYKGYIIKKP